MLLRRRLIDFTLQKARSTRYRHAVRHVREIESQQSDIKDYERHESHAKFMGRLSASIPASQRFGHCSRGDFAALEAIEASADKSSLGEAGSRVMTAMSANSAERR